MPKFVRIVTQLAALFLLEACLTSPKPAATQSAVAMIDIASAGDSFIMGDGTFGPNVVQTLTYDFKISKYEITEAEFKKFWEDGGYNKSIYWTKNGWAQRESGGPEWTMPFSPDAPGFDNDSQPIDSVSWYEAVAFCNWLSVHWGLTAVYDSTGRANMNARGYRLPTEVEWEYVAAKGARGQPERVYPWGDAWDSQKVVCGAVGKFNNFANVGSKSILGGDTPQGIADMAGNVIEWCSDNFQDPSTIKGSVDRYYFDNDSANQSFAIRGGASVDPANEYFFRCAYDTTNAPPKDRGGPRGFRIVLR